MKNKIMIGLVMMILLVSSVSGLTFNLDDNPACLGTDEVILTVKNGEVTPLTKLTAVYITGSDGNALTVKRAYSTDFEISEKTICIVAEPIGVGSTGDCVTEGRIDNLNTASFTEGSEIYLSSTPGVVTETGHVPGERYVTVGYIIRSHISAGAITVDLRQNPFMEEISDYNHSMTAVEDDFLKYTGELWEPFSLYSYFYNTTQIDNIFSDYYTSAQVDALPISTFTNDVGYITDYTETDPLSYHTDENINATGYNISADTITSYGNNVASYELSFNGSNAELKWIR